MVATEGFAARWPTAHELLTPPADAAYEADPTSAYESLRDIVGGAAAVDRAELDRMIDWVPIGNDGGLTATGLRFGRHEGPTLGGARGRMWITLNLAEQPTEGVVVHELAHLVTVTEFGEAYDDHGPEFAHTLLAVAELAHGPAAARQLRDGFMANKVLWHPARAGPSRERAESRRDAELPPSGSLEPPPTPSRPAIEGF